MELKNGLSLTATGIVVAAHTVFAGLGILHQRSRRAGAALLLGALAQPAQPLGIGHELAVAPPRDADDQQQSVDQLKAFGQAEFRVNRDIIVLNDLSRAFGKETGYTIGLVIMGFVFWTMLGFGSSEPVRLGDEDEMV